MSMHEGSVPPGTTQTWPPREPVEEPRASHPGNGHGTRPMSSLLRELANEATALGRAEFALVRTEMEQNLTTAKRGAISIGSGAVVLGVGLLALVASAILALSIVWPAWLAALVVGGGIALIGAIMLAVGRSKVKARALRPTRSERVMKDNARFARNEASRAVEKWS